MFNTSCVIQAIPLHPLRLKQRGFNQSEKITSFLQTIFSYDKINCLQRVKNTSTQAQITTRFQRYRNMRVAFVVVNKESIREKTVLLVDDVITSGASIKEAARILKQSGVQRIYAFSIARG